MGCPYLYSYEDVRTGQRFMGCVQKVFSGEIDIDMFMLAERRGGFGGIKMTGEPLPQCQFRSSRPTRATARRSSASTRRSSTRPTTAEASRPSTSATR